MGCLGGESLEVPEIVVGRLSLWDLGLGLWFPSVDDVGEFDGILNEKHGDIVPDEIPVSFTGVKLDGKSTNISDGVRRPARSENGGKSDEKGGFIRGVVEDVCARKLGDGGMQTEDTVGTRAPCMDDTLGNPLMVEMVNLHQLNPPRKIPFLSRDDPATTRDPACRPPP